MDRVHLPDCLPRRFVEKTKPENAVCPSSRIAARNSKFRHDLNALLIELNARPGAGLGYDFTLDTPVGELWISAMDSDVEPWLACMFRDKERAKFHVSDPLNPYSGKWNHMHSDLLFITQQLVSVMRIVPPVRFGAPDGHIEGSLDSGDSSNP